jgi:hypothetical protein
MGHRCASRRTDFAGCELVGIRSLRNHFAHSYVDASFSDQKALMIVTELQHFGIKRFPLTDHEKQKPDRVRWRFSLAASGLAGSIHKKAGMTGDDDGQIDGPQDS